MPKADSDGADEEQTERRLRKAILAQRKRGVSAPAKVWSAARFASGDAPVEDARPMGPAEAAYGCPTCSQLICPDNDDLRDYLCPSKPLALADVSGVNKLCTAPGAHLLEYYCPVCAIPLLTDIVLGSEDAMPWESLPV